MLKHCLHTNSQFTVKPFLNISYKIDFLGLPYTIAFLTIHWIAPMFTYQQAKVINVNQSSYKFKYIFTQNWAELKKKMTILVMMEFK